jgi:adenylylsulfate kinase-like enzyme
MVIWITGRAGAGKTAVARKLSWVLGADRSVVIDGDEFREIFPCTYTDYDRRAHIMRMAKIAAMFDQRGITPIVACVSPKKEWRVEARKMFGESRLIYLSGGSLWEGTTYEEPDDEELA